MKTAIRALLPKTIRPRRIIGGPLRGLWLVTSWHDYPAGLRGRTERPLLEWFAKHVQPGQTWLDVGGHYGYTTFALARLVGNSGRVFTFEPVPATAGCIDQGRALNGFPHVTVLPLALGAPDTLTVRPLAMTRGMADATLAAVPGQWSVTAPVARFDWLWPLINGGNGAIHGVKIDVQGMELETISGMRETLRQSRPQLVVELHAGVDRREILRLLQDLGYSTDAVAIEPARDEHAPLFLDDRSYVFRIAG
jgi:FkbM family methyltransferase